MRLTNLNMKEEGARIAQMTAKFSEMEPGDPRSDESRREIVAVAMNIVGLASA